MTDKMPRILVVDDERGMREGCRKILTHEGFEVETAEDGLAALEILEQRDDFAAALVDLKMPRMGGLELIERLQKIDGDIVIFVITAYASIDSAVVAVKRGAHGYIPKPFTPNELLLPLRNGLEKRALLLETRRLAVESEARLLEVAFEHSKSKTIIQCMTDGVFVVNRDRKIVLRNAAAARILPEWSTPFPPVPLEAVPDAFGLKAMILETLEKSSGPAIASREIVFGAGTYMVNASPVIDSNGRTLGAVAVLRDITALKTLQTAKSMFVSLVSHEIKSPLAAVEGFLRLITDDAAGLSTEKAREVVERSLVRIVSLREMVSEFMNLTAMDAGAFSLHRIPLDVREIVAEAVASNGDRAAERKTRLVLLPGGSEGNGTVLADRKALLTVFGNLIDNAIKYSGENGNVRVLVEPAGCHMKVTVRDDGIGMSEDEQEKIFDEFFRVRNQATARVPGTGLGLTLVKRLVQLHEGTITVRSWPGNGSEFYVLLPVSRRS